MVVTDLPAAALTSVTQERIAVPSTCTVQAPHMAMPQPYFVPLSLSSSRITHSKGVSGALSDVTAPPFSSNSITTFPFPGSRLLHSKCSTKPLRQMATPDTVDDNNGVRTHLFLYKDCPDQNQFGQSIKLNCRARNALWAPFSILTYGRLTHDYEISGRTGRSLAAQAARLSKRFAFLDSNSRPGCRSQSHIREPTKNTFQNESVSLGITQFAPTFRKLHTGATQEVASNRSIFVIA